MLLFPPAAFTAQPPFSQPGHQQRYHRKAPHRQRVGRGGADDGQVGHAGACGGHQHRVGVEAQAVPQRHAAHDGGDHQRCGHSRRQPHGDEHRYGDGHHRPAAAYGEHRQRHQKERQRRDEIRGHGAADAVDENVEQPQRTVGVAEHQAEAHHNGDAHHALGACKEVAEIFTHRHAPPEHIQQELYHQRDDNAVQQVVVKKDGASHQRRQRDNGVPRGGDVVLVHVRNVHQLFRGAGLLKGRAAGRHPPVRLLQPAHLGKCAQRQQQAQQYHSQRIEHKRHGAQIIIEEEISNG